MNADTFMPGLLGLRTTYQILVELTTHVESLYSRRNLEIHRDYRDVYWHLGNLERDVSEMESFGMPCPGFKTNIDRTLLLLGAAERRLDYLPE